LKSLGFSVGARRESAYAGALSTFCMGLILHSADPPPPSVTLLGELLRRRVLCSARPWP
jgi:hypothetical protein